MSYLPLAAPNNASATGDKSDASTSAQITHDEPDEDELDDEDAKKKEDEYLYDERRRAEAPEAQAQWPLRGLHALEEIDLYDNSLKSVKGLEDLPSLT